MFPFAEERRCWYKADINVNVAFRADTNHNSGIGHIMTMLSISDAFKDLGHDVHFIIADNRVSKLINKRGHEALVLNSDYKSMEEEKWPQDIQQNSYYVTPNYLSSLWGNIIRTADKLVYMDDVCSLSYSVDILVDSNAYATSVIYKKLYKYTGAEKPSLILGSTYAPLRLMLKGL